MQPPEKGGLIWYFSIQACPGKGACCIRVAVEVPLMQVSELVCSHSLDLRIFIECGVALGLCGGKILIFHLQGADAADTLTYGAQNALLAAKSLS